LFPHAAKVAEIRLPKTRSTIAHNHVFVIRNRRAISDQPGVGVATLYRVAASLETDVTRGQKTEAVLQAAAVAPETTSPAASETFGAVWTSNPDVDETKEDNRAGSPHSSFEGKPGSTFTVNRKSNGPQCSRRRLQERR
jgi:hypothetical protein